MILYHGSNIEIDVIDLAKSRPGKDFGRAFYLSDSREQAVEMAEFKVQTFGGKVVVNAFSFDNAIVHDKSFKVIRFDKYTEEWAKFILANRAAKIDEIIHNYDIVYGPIANDKIGRQIFNFQAGYIDFGTFIHRIQYPEGITYQWAFCTQKAINQLSKVP